MLYDPILFWVLARHALAGDWILEPTLVAPHAFADIEPVPQ
jgi:hypothetical protein